MILWDNFGMTYIEKYEMLRDCNCENGTSDTLVVLETVVYKIYRWCYVI